MNDDETIYTLSIVNNTLDIDKVVVLRDAIGCRMVDAKNYIKYSSYRLEGKAPEIKALKDKLDEGNISYQISPDFVY